MSHTSFFVHSPGLSLSSSHTRFFSARPICPSPIHFVPKFTISIPLLSAPNHISSQQVQDTTTASTTSTIRNDLHKHAFSNHYHSNLSSVSRRRVLQLTAASLALYVASWLNPATSSYPVLAATTILKPPSWRQIDIPTDKTIYDVSVADESRGFLIAADSLVLESKDTGSSWKMSKSFQKAISNYKDVTPYSVSFLANVGYILASPKPSKASTPPTPALPAPPSDPTGSDYSSSSSSAVAASTTANIPITPVPPSVLFCTQDSGDSWTAVSLPSRIQGTPVRAYPVSNSTVEIVTSAGMVYTSSNGGRTWKQLVAQPIDTALEQPSTTPGGDGDANFSEKTTTASTALFTASIADIQRDAQGNYVARSARGDFFLTLKKGDRAWVPHQVKMEQSNGGFVKINIGNIGFVQGSLENGVWIATRKGELAFSKQKENWDSMKIAFQEKELQTKGYGVLDVVFRPNTNDAYALLGGGSILFTKDGGNTWSRDKTLDNLGPSIMKLKFISENIAYAFGKQGILLRYDSSI